MVSSSTANHPQVIVVGGGPAGATVSTLIAQKGYSVSLFERETFPRYHIGESMIQETFDVLDRLIAKPTMVGNYSTPKVSGTNSVAETSSDLLSRLTK
jgi:flavin-dependent dehydrogenase